MDASEMERVWGEHLEAEFGTKDLEATLGTMVDDPYLANVAVGTGGRGLEEVRAFYDAFIASWPEDVRMEAVNRVVGTEQLVDEVRMTFTHTRQMDWLLPGVSPTGRPVEMQCAVIVQFRDGRIAGERIYWDHASVLRQVGLSPEEDT